MLIRVTIAFIAGILIAWRLEISATALLLFLTGAAISAAWLRTQDRAMLPAILVVALLLGALRFELSEGRPPDSLFTYHSVQGVMIEGSIEDDPQSSGSHTRLQLHVDRVFSKGAWTTVSGNVLVTLRAPLEIVAHRDKPYYRYGDRLRLQGELQKPPDLEEFDYSAYLARQGIHSVMYFPTATLLTEGGGSWFYRWLFESRHSMASSLARSVPEPQASVGQSVLLGIRDGLPSDLEDDFRATGTSHLLAISGLHVGVLLAVSLGISQAVFGRRRHLYLVIPLALIWLYTLLSGASPSAVRAAIMGTVYLAAMLSGRPRNVLPTLALAATAMVAVDPDVIWRVSFQLSFAAMAGIAVLSNPIRQSLLDEENPSGKFAFRAAVSGITGMTVAATLATLPLVAFYFQQVSLVGIPASLLTLPAMPFVLVTNAMAGFAGLVSPAIGVPLGWLAWIFSSYVTGMVSLLSRIPAASVHVGGVGVPLVIAWYAVLALAYSARRSATMSAIKKQMEVLQKLGLHLRLPNARIKLKGPMLLALPMFGLASLLWVAALSEPDPRLHVYFVDVGQGDAIFIVTPSGHQVLVDGGPDPQDIVQFLGQHMPPEDRTIDLAVLTHPHADHAAGLVEALRRYEIHTVLQRTLDYDSPIYSEWLRAVDQENADIIEAQAGQVITFDDGVVLQILSPPQQLAAGTISDVDNASIALRLTYGERSFLLAGDMFQEAEQRLLATGMPLDSDVLKVGHHGSRNASSAEFLAEVSPTIAVISAGANNRYGHPSQEALNRLGTEMGPGMTYVTGESGTIELITDGKTVELIAEK